MRRLLTMASVIIVLASCSPAEESVDTTSPTTSATTTTTTAPTTTTTELPEFSVSSPAFPEDGAVPAEYTCDGADVSPELNIVGLPEVTRAVTVIVEDPDAPIDAWYHWVDFDIPAGTGSFDIARGTDEVGTPGVNSWNLEGYMGPCPPEGEEHRYTFRIYALSSMLDLPAGVDIDEVTAAMEGHIVDTVELTGVYGR